MKSKEMTPRPYKTLDWHDTVSLTENEIQWGT